MNLLKKNHKRLIRYSDPGKILNLIVNLNVNSCAEIQTTINQYLIDTCEAETIALVVVLNNANGMEASIEAVGANVLSRKVNITMPQSFSEILKTNQAQIELLSNLETDFQDILSPYLTEDSMKRERVLLYPITDIPFSIIVCVAAPKVHQDDLTHMIKECFIFTWPTLKNSIALEYERILKTKCQHLLRVARRLFTQVGSTETLLKLAMEQAKQLTKAEYCSVMLVDVDRMELVEKYHPESDSSDVSIGARERRFPMNIGITGEVLKSGDVVNAKCASKHPTFNKDIDCYPGADCKTIMCFPIREQTGIIGVGQLINKVGDPYFDTMDEEMALAFSVYCGVCITQSLVYQKMKEAHFRNALSNELIMYHTKVTEAEVKRVTECTGFHNHPHFTSLYFNMRALPLRELPCYVLKMFSDLGFIKKFHINEQVLVRFILHVKKGYRDVPYHNWMHAFNVAQWAYAAILNFKLVTDGYLSELQAFAYLLAALVHDMDHRGTTNTFQIQGQTTLAALYSSEGSVMERHHISQAMAVLNAPECEILESLRRRDYDRAILTLRDLILATDLANYFKNINQYDTISQVYEKSNRSHTTALQCLLMNAADLSEQLKEWSSVKKTAVALLTEFFRQGDEEKSRGDLPVWIMDRDKCFIPDLQIQFLSTTCVPLYEILGRILPKANGCKKIIENNIERWEAAKPIFAEVPITAGLSVLTSPELDDLIREKLKETKGEEILEL